jgi:choline transport protein
MAMVILANPSITYHNWNGFIVLGTVINIFGHKWLPYLHRAGFMICLTSFFLINMTMIGTVYPKNSAAFAFNTFTNGTGWASSRIAFIVGLTNPAFAFGGLDGAIHMAEEMKGVYSPRRSATHFTKDLI